MLQFRMQSLKTIRKATVNMDSSHQEDCPRLMEAPEITELVRKIAAKVCEENRNAAEESLVLIGIQRGGALLAERLVREIQRLTNRLLPLGILDITMYRDDIGLRKTLPMIFETSIPFDTNGKTIILVDDILQTGRSIRAALDAITDYGRPAIVKLAALLDRGNLEFPIRGDYVGKVISLDPSRRLQISWSELTGKEDYVYSIPNPNIRVTP